MTGLQIARCSMAEGVPRIHPHQGSVNGRDCERMNWPVLIALASPQLLKQR
jgi:hypothetical protein